MSLTKEEYMKIINQTKKTNFTLNETTLNNKLHEIKLQDQHNKLKEKEIYILQTKIKEFDIKLEEQQNREKEYKIKENEFEIKIEEFNLTQNKIQQENNSKEQVLKIKENKIQETYIKIKEYESNLNQIKIQQEKELNDHKNKMQQEYELNINQLKSKEKEVNEYRNKMQQEYELNINQLKSKEKLLIEHHNKMHQEYEKKVYQHKTKEKELDTEQNKIKEEYKKKTSEIQTKEEDLNKQQNKMQQEYQLKIHQLKMKEKELDTDKNKMQMDHHTKINQLKLKEKEYESKINQLKSKERENDEHNNKIQQENDTKINQLKTKEQKLIEKENKIKQDHDTKIAQLKMKEQELIEKENKIKEDHDTKIAQLKLKEQEIEMKKNTDFLPHITIVKIPCMMYIIYILQDELIKMGWNCSIIDKSEINNYIYLNNKKHYFLFLLANQIHKNIIVYKRYILYQLEQNVNNELSVNYKQLHETKQLQQIYDNATLLIDYSEININVTKKYYSNEFKLMNVPAINKINMCESYDSRDSYNSYEYDIIFIGSINKRRKDILDKLKEKYKVLIVNDIYGEELKQLCDKSNICLNIHYYDNAILERVRLNEMMDYGIKIISEKPYDDTCNYASVHFINMIQDSNDELYTTIEKIKNKNTYNDLKHLHSIFTEDIKIFKNICILPKSVAVITANYGNYDSIKEVNIDNKDYFDWFLFTDNDIKSETYNVIDYSFDFDYAHNNDFNRLYAKYIKCQALNIDILKKYDYIIWTDSSLQIKNKNLITDIMNLLKNKNDLYFYNHYCRNNIIDEYKISKPLSKYENHHMEEQITKYIDEKFTDNFLYECGIFIIKNNEKNIKIMNDWWDENIIYSYQDQLSLPYVLWKNNAKPYVLNDKEIKGYNGSVWDNKLFGMIQKHK
jgi:hypothetical protein